MEYVLITEDYGGNITLSYFKTEKEAIQKSKEVQKDYKEENVLIAKVIKKF